MAALTISVLVHNRAEGAVNGQFLPVDTESGELSIEVREVASL